jgi:large subunit ribosomal protein L30
MAGRLRVTLRKSPISYKAKAHGTLRSLGLRRVGQTVEVADDPVMRGMARAVRFLVEVEEVQGAEGVSAAATTPAAAATPSAPRARRGTVVTAAPAATDAGLTTPAAPAAEEETTR